MCNELPLVIKKNTMTFEYIPNQYKNALLDRKNSIFIMNIFFEFKKTFFIFNIPDEIFKLIMEFYYNCCIYQSFCIHFKCIKRFKKYFNQKENEETNEIWVHCQNCHRSPSYFECSVCYDCQKLCCGFCSKEFQHLTYRCYLCNDNFNKKLEYISKKF